MLSGLRSGLRPIVAAVAKPIAATRIHPNAFSFLGVILAFASTYYTINSDFAPAFALALLAVSIDLFDGEVARLQKKDSLFGNYFETVVDKIVEVVLFAGTAFIHPIASIVALGSSMLVSYAKPRVALVIITDNRDWPGLGEHAERMLLLILGLLLAALGVSVGPLAGLEACLWAITLVSLFGLLQRLLFARSLIEEAEKKGSVLPYLKK